MTSTISLTTEVGVKNSPPLEPLTHGKLAEEILVNLAEGIALYIQLDGVKNFQQLHQNFVIQTFVCFGENTLKFFILGFNRFHP